MLEFVKWCDSIAYKNKASSVSANYLSANHLSANHLSSKLASLFIRREPVEGGGEGIEYAVDSPEEEEGVAVAMDFEEGYGVIA